LLVDSPQIDRSYLFASMVSAKREAFYILF